MDLEIETREYLSKLLSRGYKSQSRAEEQAIIWDYASQIVNYQNLHKKRDAVIAELGSLNGVTSALMCHAIERIHKNLGVVPLYDLYVVEFDKDKSEKILQLKDEEGLNTKVVLGDDLDVVDKIIDEHGRIDLCFIDSDHTENHVRMLLETLHRSTSEIFQVIMLHDYKFSNGDGFGVSKAFTDWYRRYHDYYSIPITHLSLIYTARMR